MKYTFNKDGWTDWITHDHKGCPCVGWYVRCETDVEVLGEIPANYRKVGPKVVEGIPNTAQSGSWSGNPEMVLVQRYKVRKPLGASKLEEMLKDLPKTVDKSLVKA